jgi:Immunoglobulin-like domain of bacterial spore germination/Sporulation and spore germination
MSGRIVSGLCLIALLALAGCGGATDTTSTQTTATLTTEATETTNTTPPETTALRVYFLRDGRVQPVARQVTKTQAVALAALDQLYKGPTHREQQLGLSVDLPIAALEPTLRDGGVLDLGSPPAHFSRPGLAQLVYTLTQFPTVKAVEVSGKRYTRAGFEDETPIILVESPLPYETAGNPIRATGTANTFEATFQYDVVDPDGNVVDTQFVTATSGSGTRGTFDFTTKPFTVSHPGLGALVVYELSAKDGSRIHETKIPLRMTQSG